MSKMVQKTFKLPEDWSIALTKKVGQRMADTGEDCSLASLIKEALDERYDLSKTTGVDSEGAPVSESPGEHQAARNACIETQE